MARSGNEQLLLDLVRRRDQEPPFFLEASPVVTGYTFSGDLESAANLGREGRLEGDAGSLDSAFLAAGGERKRLEPLAHPAAITKHFIARLRSMK